MYKKLWVLLGILLMLVVDVLLFIKYPFIPALIVVIIVSYIIMLVVRYVVLQEKFFRGNYNDIRSSNFNLEPMKAWGIVDISKSKPYICTFNTGSHGVFLFLHHGSLTGKPQSFRDTHYQVIRDVVGELVSRGIELQVINLNSDLKTDKRFNTFLDRQYDTGNQKLDGVLESVNHFIGNKMEVSLKQFDILCLKTVYGDMRLRLALKEVLPLLTESNIVGYSYMGFNDLSVLLEGLYGFEDFSLKHSLQGLEKSSVLKLLWVEKDGVRTEFMKSSKDIDALKKVAESEKRVRRKFTSRFRGSDDDIEL